MLKRSYWIALFFVPALFAQGNPGAAPSGWGTKTIQLKYLDPDDLRQVFSGRSYVMQIDRNLKLLTVSGPPEFVNEVEQMGKRLDAAPEGPADVQVTLYLLTTGAQGMPEKGLPPELKDIDRILPQYASLLNLADSETLRVREGRAGEISSTDAPPSGVSLAFIGVQSVSVIPSAKGDRVSLSGLRCKINKPSGKESSTGDITANIDLVQDQATLVAKAGGEKPLILVVRASIAP